MNIDQRYGGRIFHLEIRYKILKRDKNLLLQSSDKKNLNECEISFICLADSFFNIYSLNLILF